MVSQHPLFTSATFPIDQVAELEFAIHLRLGRRVSQFRLSGMDQGLILRGRAKSFYAKQLAQEEVMKLTNTSILANEIEVL